MRAPLLPIVILVLFHNLWLSTCPLCAQSTPTPTDAVMALGTLKSKKITESSGLARSHFVNDAWWTMNDSGHNTDVYMFGDQGQTLAVCKLKEANNRDWEAMSSFQREGKHFLLVADVGDNQGRRERCQIYVFEEPKFQLKKKKIFSKKLHTKKIEFRYEDGPRNCEAVACDPEGKTVFLIEKIFLETNKRQHPGIYQLELVFDQDDTENKGPTLHVAKRIASFPFRGVTGMAISPNGKRLAIRNYLSAHLFERLEVEGVLPTWQSVFRNLKPKFVPTPLQVQGEAITFTGDNEHLILTSETAGQTIWKVHVGFDQQSNHDVRNTEQQKNPAPAHANPKPATPLKTTEAK